MRLFFILFFLSVNILAAETILTNKEAVGIINTVQEKTVRSQKDTVDIKKAVKQIATGWTPKQ